MSLKSQVIRVRNNTQITFENKKAAYVTSFTRLSRFSEISQTLLYYLNTIELKISNDSTQKLGNKFELEDLNILS